MSAGVQMYGYYSAMAAEECGGCFYSTPDGREVHVTVIDSSDNISEIDYNWPDTVFVGPVEIYLRQDSISRNRSEQEYQHNFYGRLGLRARV